MRFSLFLFIVLVLGQAPAWADLNSCVNKKLTEEEERLQRMEEADKARYKSQLEAKERERQEAPKIAEQIARQKEESYRLAGEYDEALRRPMNIKAGTTSKGDIAVVRSEVFKEKLGTDEALVRVVSNSGRDMNNRQVVEVEVYGGLKKGEKFTLRLHENQVDEWTTGHQTTRAQELMRQGDAEVKNKIVTEVKDAFSRGKMTLTGDEIPVARSMNFNLQPNNKESRIVLDMVRTNDYTKKERVSLHYIGEDTNGRKIYQAKDGLDAKSRPMPGEKYYMNKGDSRVYKMGNDDYGGEIPIYHSIQKVEIP